MTAWRVIACAIAIAAAACSSDDRLANLRAKRAEEGVRRVVTELLSEPGALYNRSSPELKGRRERMSFIGQAEDLARVMGAFEGGVRVTSVDVAHGSRGRTARVKAVLEFEHGSIDGWVSFQEGEEEWMPLGFELPIPASLEDAWDEARAERGAGPAPKGAIDAAETILAELGEGRAANASDAAASAAAHAMEQLGAYERFVRDRWSRIDAAGSRARIAAVLAYETTWAHAELELVPSPDADLPWNLESLRIVEPEPPHGPSTP